MLLKKIIISLSVVFFLAVEVFANIVPKSVNDIPNSSIGLYQADSTINIYKEPKVDSVILKQIKLVNSEYRESAFENVFAVLIPKKVLAYMYVTDITDDWVEVIYDKKNMLRGWVCKSDDFQFLPWVNFINMYGRKYGLKYLKDVPDNIYYIHTQTEFSSKILGQTIKSREIRLTNIEGNWMLVSVLDSTYSINTGYIIWRTTTGEIYLFPNIK